MLKEAPNLKEDIEARDKLELLYRLYATKLLHVAKGILKNSHDAEGVVHSAFIKVIYILDKIENPEEKRTYALLVTIVRNLCYDKMRKWKYEELVDFSETQLDMVDAKSPEQIYVEKETSLELQEYICAMPEKYKIPMILYYVHDLSVKEISVILGISQNLASIRLSRGRKYMKEVVKKTENITNETDLRKPL